MFIFDVLPVRAEIEPLESITGFITRLCWLNSIFSVRAASTLLFPSQSSRVISLLKDYPPLYLEEIALATRISKTDLLKTTFYHIGRKFNRSTHPQALSRFLADAVSPYFRYCPLCLAENPYHKLTWRFAAVMGCRTHHCRLCERCMGCNRLLPFFKAPLSIGFCPYCNSDLCLSLPTPLSNVEQKLNSGTVNDIEFLLLPREWEVGADRILPMIGNLLAQMREHQQCSVKYLAAVLAVSTGMIEGMEKGDFSTRGATFIAYQRYITYLGISFKDLFAQASLQKPKAKKSDQLTKQELILKSEEALKQLVDENQKITSKAVADIVEIPRSTLIRHTEIAQLISQAEKRRRQLREDDLVKQAQFFLADLYPEPAHCAQETLAALLGISRAQLRRTKRLMSLLNTYQ